MESHGGSNPNDYGEAIVEPWEVAAFTAPMGRAHSLRNLDKVATLNIMVCADTTWDPENPDTDYKIWKDV